MPKTGSRATEYIPGNKPPNGSVVAWPKPSDFQRCKVTQENIVGTMAYPTIVQLSLENLLQLAIIFSDCVCKLGCALTHQQLPLCPLIVVFAEYSGQLLKQFHLVKWSLISKALQLVNSYIYNTCYSLVFWKRGKVLRE